MNREKNKRKIYSENSEVKKEVHAWAINCFFKAAEKRKHLSY
jgi:hypothetical protein